jgi:YegS/Rv2252/BmrU family lipid kinase
MSTFVIVNPKSRLGETERRMPELSRLLDQHLGPHTLLETTQEGDGERLACVAVDGGATRIVVAGGDGTMSEVVSGLMHAGALSRVEVASLPLGTGRDYARLLGLGRDMRASVERIARGKKKRVDVGRIESRQPDGTTRTRCFLNIASFGLTGESMLWLREQAAQGKRNKLSYVTSGLVGLSRYAGPPVTLRVDGEVVHEGPLLFAVCANGQYFAGGMRVAPRAFIDDGKFDLVIAPKLPVTQSLLRFPLLMVGKHIDGQKIRMVRGRVLDAQTAQVVWIEADGEPVGMLPARFELLPQALTLTGMP